MLRADRMVWPAASFFIFRLVGWGNASAAEAAAGRRCRIAAQGRFTQFEWKGKANFIHGVHHFVEWHRMVYAGQGQLCTGEGVGHADGISALAWGFYKSGNRVTYQPQKVGKGQAGSVKTLGRAAAQELGGG